MPAECGICMEQLTDAFFFFVYVYICIHVCIYVCLHREVQCSHSRDVSGLPLLYRFSLSLILLVSSSGLPLSLYQPWTYGALCHSAVFRCPHPSLLRRSPYPLCTLSLNWWKTRASHCYVAAPSIRNALIDISPGRCKMWTLKSQ